MCGLTYGRRSDNLPIAKAVLKRYKNQSNRGKQGFGYVTIKDNKIENYKRFVTESEMEKELLKETAPEILFHHRLPTSTPNEAEFNHPFFISHKTFKHDYYFVHNGVISNDDTLKKKHDDLGYKYQTQQVKTVTTITTKSIAGKVTEEVDTTETIKFNDSEALAYEIARYIEGFQDNIEAIGSIAFICIQTDKNGNVKKLFYGRNDGNPLVIERDKNSEMFFLKSEGGGYKMDSDEIVSVDHLTGETEIESVPVGKRYSYTPSNYGTSRYWDKDRKCYKTWDTKSKTWIFDDEEEDTLNSSQSTFGFNTKFEKEESKEMEEDLTDVAVLESMLEQNEAQLEVLVEEEFQLVEKQKELNQRLAKSKNKIEMFNINSDLMSVTEDLIDTRKKISRLEMERDQLDDIEQQMADQNKKLLEANL